MLPAPIIFQENNENAYAPTKSKVGKAPVDSSAPKKGLGFSQEKSKSRKALSSLSTSQINIRSNTIQLETNTVKKKSAVSDVPPRIAVKEEFVPDASEMVCSSKSSKWFNEDPYDEVHKAAKDIKYRILPFVPVDLADLPAKETIPEFDFSWNRLQKDPMTSILEEEVICHAFPDFSRELEFEHD